MAECRVCRATFHVGDPHECPGPPPGRYLLLDVVIGLVIGSVVGSLIGIPVAGAMGEPMMRAVCQAAGIVTAFLGLRAIRRAQRG